MPLLILHKNNLTLIAPIILTILGLTLFSNPVCPQEPVNDIQNQDDVNLVLQVGAFVKLTNATVFKEKLAAIIDKPVIMVTEEGYYKVQLTGFKNVEEIEKIIPALGLIGIRDFWIPRPKKVTDVTDYVDLQPDTIQKIPEEKTMEPLISTESDSLVTESDSQVIEETSADPSDTFALEIGSFRKQNRAVNAQEKVISKLKLPVEIAEQWEEYHVIITGFNNKTEINKYIPELAKMGYSEIYVLKNYKKIQ